MSTTGLYYVAHALHIYVLHICVCLGVGGWCGRVGEFLHAVALYCMESYFKVTEDVEE